MNTVVSLALSTSMSGSYLLCPRYSPSEFARSTTPAAFNVSRAYIASSMEPSRSGRERVAKNWNRPGYVTASMCPYSFSSRARFLARWTSYPGKRAPGVETDRIAVSIFRRFISCRCSETFHLGTSLPPASRPLLFRMS
ncbi:hypothetical protein Mapa_000247 [Marchantia paleacea]|nr:hypothetical protein Mapa_000247 [Marchantia paleacea]